MTTIHLNFSTIDIVFILITYLNNNCCCCLIISAAAFLCHSCFMPGLRTSPCGACKCVSYCSVKCQEKTWKYHKHLYKAVVASTKNNNNDDSTDHSDTNFGLILDGMGPCGDKDINTKPLYQEMISQA